MENLSVETKNKSLELDNDRFDKSIVKEHKPYKEKLSDPRIENAFADLKQKILSDPAFKDNLDIEGNAEDFLRALDSSLYSTNDVDLLTETQKKLLQSPYGQDLLGLMIQQSVIDNSINIITQYRRITSLGILLNTQFDLNTIDQKIPTIIHIQNIQNKRNEVTAQKSNQNIQTIPYLFENIIFQGTNETIQGLFYKRLKEFIAQDLELQQTMQNTSFQIIVSNYIHDSNQTQRNAFQKEYSHEYIASLQKNSIQEKDAESFAWSLYSCKEKNSLITSDMKEVYLALYQKSLDAIVGSPKNYHTLDGYHILTGESYRKEGWNSRLTGYPEIFSNIKMLCQATDDGQGIGLQLMGVFVNRDLTKAKEIYDTLNVGKQGRLQDNWDKTFPYAVKPDWVK